MSFADQTTTNDNITSTHVHTDPPDLRMHCDEQEVETLVDTLTIDGATLNDALSNCDLQQLAELSQELHLNSEMDQQHIGEEEVMDIGDSVVAEEIVEQTTEIGEQEVVVETETETERAPTPEEILPDVEKSVKVAAAAVLPPLKPLTIAPKPAKMPITLKPVAGQQLLLLQGGTTGQAIKLINPQGQELNLSNISLGRTLPLKSTVKTLTTPTSSNTLVQHPKQTVVMKRVIAPANKAAIPRTTSTASKQPQSHIVVVQKPTEQQQQPQQGVKLLQSAAGGGTLSNPPTKTISLQQAQEMGLITTMTKFVSQGGGGSGGKQQHTLLLNKPPAKAIKIVPQKSPTKILPAPQLNTTNKIPQRLIIKPTNTSQLIQVPQQLASTQLHQINIPGKGVQYIKFVTSTTADSSTTQVINTASTTKTVLQNQLQVVTSGGALKSGNIVLSELKPIPGPPIAPKPAPKPAPTTRPSTTVQMSSPTAGQAVVVLPSSFIPQPTTQLNSKVAIPVIRNTTIQKSTPTPTPPETAISATTNDTASLESNGIRPRKPCNCTKSQCLKLYCDCFANGEFCYLCNCMNCFNNIQNEEHRQRAIKNCLERNPHAFRPKIGKAKDNSGDVAVRKHTKGCNCKRSGCLKNYCECYEAKIACSSNCKCIGCRNIEDSMEKKSLRPQAMNDSYLSSGSTPTSKLGLVSTPQMRSRRGTNNRQAFSLITNEVIEATSQCLLALTDNVENDVQSEEETKTQIIEEFGRCLMEIISCSGDYNSGSSNNNNNNAN